VSLEIRQERKLEIRQEGKTKNPKTPINTRNLSRDKTNEK